MKKRALIFCCILITLVGVAFIVKSQLRTLVIQTINTSLKENLNARVLWDPEKLSISFFKDFPNISAQLSQIGVINQAPFEDQVLFYADNFYVSIDTWSLFSAEYKVNGIMLDRPIIHVQISEGGQANYDIAQPAKNDSSPSASNQSVALSIDHWEIIDGTLIYEDMTTATFLEMKHIEHRGGGNFKPGEISINVALASDSLFLTIDEVNYVQNKMVLLDADVGISDDFSRFVLNESSVALNDFQVEAHGEIGITDSSNYEMNIEITAPQNDFSNLLSLVPGMYTSDFEDISTTGTFDFQANLRGTLSATEIPAFQLMLMTHEAAFQYKDMPVGVEKINLDVLAENTTGNLNDTRLALNTLSMMIGKNPLEAKLIIENLENYPVDGFVKSRVDLGELNNILLLDDRRISGTGIVDVSVKGIYDSVQQIMPALDATLGLESVTFEETSLNYRLDDVNVAAVVKNGSGKFSDLLMQLTRCDFILENQKIGLTGEIRDLTNLTWALNTNGTLNLEKLSGLFHLDDYGVQKGQLKMNIQTSGNMRALEEERYVDLPTSGSLDINNLTYVSTDLPDVLTIGSANVTFDPSKLTITSLKATMGESDYRLDGDLNNYLKYALHPDEPLQGDIQLTSNRVNMDDLMMAESPADTTTSNPTMMRIPPHLDIAMAVDIKTLIISGISLQQMKANARMADEEFILDDFSFAALGGEVSGRGLFQTKTAVPRLAINFDANNIDIAKTAGTLDFVKRFFPITKLVTGDYGIALTLSSEITEDLSFDLNSINARGTVECVKASLTSMAVTDQITSLTGIEESKVRSIEDLMMQFEIKDGQVNVKPFDVRIGGLESNIFGTQALDGSIAYEMTMQIPAGEIGKKLNTFINANSGNSDPEVFPVTLGIGGTIEAPEVMLLMGKEKELVKQALKQQASEEASELTTELIEKVDDEKMRELLTSIQGKEKPADSTTIDVKDSTKTDAEELKKQALDEVKNFFKKKKKANDNDI